MTISSHKLGPGQLSIGAIGSLKEFGVALTKGQLTPEADDGETITVLSGEELIEEGEETWTLEGSVFQSYDADSLILWCNENSGQTLPFTFKPATAQALEAAGKVLVRSIAIGGDVKARNQSDFKFKATDVVLSAGV
ncbi:hypothetical protein G7085_12830 [Tessaracoccus sp. HDW20]|uniref:hypothetical protein n=1 Tax=Tessaracoccus coleopterorum TaxID=2714950 RepID=UPI0018D3E5D0|nr:hypothetical protein [Tessaracoccus coleopterorum]NHB85210.1 hypothetical protein [Tessaracoccus coleopterorum]